MKYENDKINNNNNFAESKEGKKITADPLAKFQEDKNEAEKIGIDEHRSAGESRSNKADSKVVSADPCINANSKIEKSIYNKK